MTLAEKILSLRTTYKMSQAELADKLEVSRQSVSKWELGESVPTLDKLILMSQLFNITLDELVNNETSEEIKITQVSSINTNEKKHTTQHSLGLILIGIGLFGCVVGFVFSRELMILSLLSVFYGIICLTVKKNLGFICEWMSVFVFYMLLVISTGAICPIFQCFIEPLMNIFTIISYLFWILFIIMVSFTIKNLKKKS